MFGLTQYRPTLSPWRLTDYIDSLFRESLPVSYGSFWLTDGLKPTIDIIEKEDHYVVKAEVPGFIQDEIELTVEKDVLTIKGVKKVTEEKEETYYCKEGLLGNFTRSVKLGGDIHAEGIKAHLKDGILTVELPKVEAMKKFKVEIT